ncbi:MFS transporter [Actinoplanes sp. NPDC026619]|uniref:MFS transporter n=1 Tax=Actinoplanes sp. NPDC026619 TaxID=3155798 RepID=UPI0033D6536C
MKAVIAAVGLPAFMVSLDNLVVTTALPAMRTAFDASTGDLQWIVDAYTLPYAALLLTAAALGDRFGRRLIFMIGIVVFTCASAGCALATTVGALMIARAVQGASGAFVMTLSLALLAAGVPAGRRPLAIALWSGFTGLGVAIGPVLGGAVVEGLHWTWIFWLNVPVGLVAMLLAGRLLSESRGQPRRIDLGGIALLTTSIFVLVRGVVEAPAHGWSSPRVLAALAGGAAVFGLFLWWQSRSAAPMLPLRLFRSREFSVINTLSFSLNIGVYGSIFLLAQFFQVVQGADPLQAGLRTLPCSLVPLFVGPATGLLMARWGAPRLVVAGQALVALSLVWMATVFAADVPFPVLFGPFLLAGIGLGLSYPPISAVALEAVPEHERGVAAGVNNTARELGVAVGVAMLVSIFATEGGYTPTTFVDGLVPALAAAAVIVAAGTALALLLPGVRRAQLLATGD